MPTPKRILWLHPVPEHYFNCMMDALAGASDYTYVAAFAGRGPGVSKEVPVPRKAQSVFLRHKDPSATGGTNVFSVQHVDWRADLLPLKFDMAVVAGYAGRTQRQVIAHCRRTGVPVAMFSDSNLRSQKGRGLKARLKRSLKRRLLGPIIRDVDLLLTANSLGVAYWRYYGAPRDKIVLCPYYADYGRVDAARRTDRAEVLARFGLPPAAKVIVTGARLVPAKGLHLMINAFRALGLAGRGWTYCVAGTGPLEAELKALAGDLEGKAVRFLGFQQPSQLLALIHHAHLFAFPSVYEPHGIVVHESLAAGTPVLSSDASGSAYDLVTPGESGWLFRSGDQADLTRVLKLATDTDAASASLRGSARAVFEDWFARTNPVTVIDRLAHELLGDRTTVPA